MTEEFKPDICIYHGGCVDGFTAAFAIWLRFGDDVDYIPAQYGDIPPPVASKNVVIVDFSYPRETLIAMADVANSLLVLDHHKTAAKDLADGNDVIAHNNHRDPWEANWEGFTKVMKGVLSRSFVYTVFDMERSGAGIAWDFFHESGQRPKLFDAVEDRDLWLFKYDNTKAIHAFISAHEQTFAKWLEHMTQLDTDYGLASAVAEGAAICRKHDIDVEAMVKATRRTMRIGGIDIQVANVPYTMASDAGQFLSKGQPYAATYCDGPKGRQFSLRSQAEYGHDVSVIAKNYGGGGHKNAAGFMKPLGWEGDMSKSDRAREDQLEFLVVLKQCLRALTADTIGTIHQDDPDWYDQVAEAVKRGKKLCAKIEAGSQ